LIDHADRTWWRHAVVYQVYIRSFADGNGDGIGDIEGLRYRLPYLRDLGVDAIWITPWYPSPMADGGYDVADYRNIDPAFGTLADAGTLIAEAHRHGIRVLVDLVPNHTSDRHPWFQAALALPPGSAERDRYWFRPGRGADGSLPPNDWRSAFGGPAWTRVTELDGKPGEWYLHLFSPGQPDLNWDNPDVRGEFESILRFWLDRGVDGFRIDVAHGLLKDPDLPDLGDRQRPGETELAAIPAPGFPYWDRDDVPDIYRAWRHVADEYDGARVFVAEAWVASPARLARYVQPGRLHTAFNFDYLTCAWNAAQLRTAIDATLGAHRAAGAPPTWVLSNHDVIRHVTRYGRNATSTTDARKHYGAPADLDLGTRRARAAALLMLALPGGAYIYQGEELGLWEAEDLPGDVRQDPAWERSGRTGHGRDGCRVPFPWSGAEPPFGFTGGDIQPWLPQPPAWKTLTAETQHGDPISTLTLYRNALQLRRQHPALGDGDLAWDGPDGDVLSLTRDPGFRCIVNLSTKPIRLPARDTALLASGPLDDGFLPSDTAIWLGR
jgi:alpha-glucosidase